MKYNT